MIPLQQQLQERKVERMKDRKTLRQEISALRSTNRAQRQRINELRETNQGLRFKNLQLKAEIREGNSDGK